MPRPTPEVRELRDAVDTLRAKLAVAEMIEGGLRKDLAGADRSNKLLQDTVVQANNDAHRDAEQLMDAQSRYHALLRKHQLVCMMWANTMAQLDTVVDRGANKYGFLGMSA